METRIFRFIKNDYELTEYGDLYKLPYTDVRIQRYNGITNILNRHNKGKQYNPKPDKDGYLSVKLYSDGKCKAIRLHHLVYMIFIQNLTYIDTATTLGYNFSDKNYIQINHIDGNKLNNHYSNLELITLQDNIKHAVKKGIHNSQIKAVYVDIYKNGIYQDTVWKLRAVSDWLEQRIGKGINSGTLSRIARNGLSYKGYTFMYRCNDYPAKEYNSSELEVESNQ